LPKVATSRIVEEPGCETLASRL